MENAEQSEQVKLVIFNITASHLSCIQQVSLLCLYILIWTANRLNSMYGELLNNYVLPVIISENN